METKAKSKAQEIFYKFKSLNLTDEIAKQCALFEVNELIKLADRVSDFAGNYFRLTSTGDYGYAILELNFWSKVNTELNKL